MAPKSLAEQIADLEDLTPRDFDPEDIERGGQSSDDEAPVKDASAGREHYQAVGKGKLRKEDPISLGKQYASSRVSRDALEAESDDDPFAARSSDEESGDEDEDLSDDDDISDGSEDEKPPKFKTASRKRVEDDLDGMDTDGSEGSEDDMEDFDEEEISEEDGDEDEDEDDEDDEDDEEDEKPAKRRVKFDSGFDDREQLRQLMATDQKTIAATISQAAKADATKGKAVKQQRATFDALLNARIKFQKGLTAVNQLSVAARNQTEDDEVDADAFRSAETAALTLWSTLEDLRLTLADAQTQDESKKRKRPSPATSTTATSSLWARMTDLESTAVTHRRAILDKWSLKVRGANTTTLANSKTNKLLGSASAQQTITAVLDAHIASETADSRAAKRARNNMPATNGTSTSNPSEAEEPIYTDALFYQSLLRDLVEQRMSSSDAITNGLDTLHLLPSRDVHPVTGMRKDKVKRDVDTRASKGRKMRFDVHEKLQNFMAPEERGTWTLHARDEFFASLLGKTASGLLGEEEDEVHGERSDVSEDDDAEEGGLRLFRC
ncbi:Putative Apoptosis antagonizing transcription factor/protein transport protein [Aspergillus calidoustus]|uniref:Protein BFR2 n=1 Tax=Aspergillus calidoustus TaxID=454130 RepID=A0A0U5G051_ASPCI|nr:Putative Apoptosis antagonizing transcription factor/protein transport protein [Aspergillus calidoustus]